ncbi:Protein prenyltransferase alpha subunit repeat-containing protein 1 [Polyrhizophydium stewartii]|uniref:Protein prenyltransferase alpha subunit repeat-containing protein 1 n=1 Tax=Polyrhizophydium stewartii TaxID=2732419 RepID=A0ABR4N465_9FUNG
MRAWCRAHVSDHSGWAFRLALLLALAADADDAAADPAAQVALRAELAAEITAEITLLHALVDLCPGHESLWSHLRSVARLAALHLHAWAADPLPAALAIDPLDPAVQLGPVSADPDAPPSRLSELAYARAVAGASPVDEVFAVRYARALVGLPWLAALPPI